MTEEHKIKIGKSNKISLLGNIPWNKGKKFSQICGKNHHNYGKYDYGKKKHLVIHGKDRQMSHVVWCKANKLPRVPFAREKICLIHHIDGNRENNKIENLQLLPYGWHTTLHKKIHNEMQ